VSDGVLEYLAPWTRGQKGVVVTNQDFPKSDDYDVIELHNHGDPGENGDRRYPWVLGTMFEQTNEPLSKTLRWLIDHVEDAGVVMIHLPYTRYKSSQVLELVQMAVQGAWIISNEIRDGNLLLVLRAKAPAKDDEVTFYLHNRSEVGDTLSLIPLINTLKFEWPNCRIFIREDKHNLVPAEVCDRIKTWVDGVFYQETQRNEFGDYYRRVEDFYFYPIRMAMRSWPRTPTSLRGNGVMIAGAT
jgi:hypothetical protein